MSCGVLVWILQIASPWHVAHLVLMLIFFVTWRLALRPGFARLGESSSEVVRGLLSGGRGCPGVFFSLTLSLSATVDAPADTHDLLSGCAVPALFNNEQLLKEKLPLISSLAILRHS